jgi:hypothetical protein
MPAMSSRRFLDRFRLPLAKAFLVVCALVVGLGACWLAAAAYALANGIRDSHYRHENTLPMWQSHARIGYVNKPNVSLICQGNVTVRTDASGFRLRPSLDGKKKPALRVFGIGDSIMWGAGVAEGDSIMGVLRTSLQAKFPDVDVVNAGVVGYSTYQTALLLKEYVAPLSPDLVVANFCFNDILPTEDPFSNLRGIHAEYLTGIMNNPETPFSAAERGILGEFVAALDSAAGVWECYQALEHRPGFQETLHRALVELPIAEMARLAKKHDFRLVYLIIPRSIRTAEDAGLVEKLEGLFVRHGIASINLQWLAAENPVPRISLAGRIADRAARIAPFRLAKTVSMVCARERLNEQSHYLDRYHLSRKASRLTAESLYELVSPSL